MYKIPAPSLFLRHFFDCMKKCSCHIVASMSHSFRIWKAIAIKIQTELAKDLGKRDWDRIDTTTSVNIFHLIFCLSDEYSIFFSNGMILRRKLDLHCTMPQHLYQRNLIRVNLAISKKKKRESKNCVKKFWICPKATRIHI